MPDRLNMPEISSAAHKTLSERPDYLKQPTNQISENIIKCKSCHKKYNQTKALQILAELPTISAFTQANYAEQCLNCIKEDSQRMKASYQPELKEAKESLAELTLVYQKAHNSYKALSAKYQEHDYIEKMILHHLSKPVKEPKAATTKKKASSSQNNQATAMKMLSKLSKDQQAALIALITKGKTL